MLLSMSHTYTHTLCVLSSYSNALPACLFAGSMEMNDVGEERGREAEMLAGTIHTVRQRCTRLYILHNAQH